MNIALTHIQQAARACLCSRNAFVRAVVLGCAVAGASVPALAGSDRDQDAPRNHPHQQPANREQPRAERSAPQQQPQQRADMPRQEPRQYDTRVYDTRMYDTRAEEQRHQQAQQQDQGARRGGRLTPDERRELRRQINEAGTDLYPNTPRR